MVPFIAPASQPIAVAMVAQPLAVRIEQDHTGVTWNQPQPTSMNSRIALAAINDVECTMETIARVKAAVASYVDCEAATCSAL